MSVYNTFAISIHLIHWYTLDADEHSWLTLKLCQLQIAQGRNLKKLPYNLQDEHCAQYFFQNFKSEIDASKNVQS